MTAFVLAAAASTAFASQAPSTIIEGCGRSGPRIDQGQSGIRLAETALTVKVPGSGTYFSLPGVPGEPQPALFICHVESGSSIVLDARTGAEVTRTLGDPSATAILDDIAASARVESTPTMTPPRTGSAGLMEKVRRRD